MQPQPWNGPSARHLDLVPCRRAPRTPRAKLERRPGASACSAVVERLAPVPRRPRPGHASLKRKCRPRRHRSARRSAPSRQAPEGRGEGQSLQSYAAPYGVVPLVSEGGFLASMVRAATGAVLSAFGTHREPNLPPFDWQRQLPAWAPPEVHEPVAPTRRRAMSAGCGAPQPPNSTQATPHFVQAHKPTCAFAATPPAVHRSRCAPTRVQTHQASASG